MLNIRLNFRLEIEMNLFLNVHETVAHLHTNPIQMFKIYFKSQRYFNNISCIPHQP